MDTPEQPEQPDWPENVRKWHAHELELAQQAADAAAAHLVLVQSPAYLALLDRRLNPKQVTLEQLRASAQVSINTKLNNPVLIVQQAQPVAPTVAPTGE